MTPGTTPSHSTSRLGRTRWVHLAWLAPAALVLAACASNGGSTGSGATPAAAAVAGTPSVAAGAILGTATTPLGAILVDGQGKAVYLFAADTPGKSNCSGSCSTYWPPVTAPTTLPAAPAGVSAKLGEIMRADGTHQLTVDGLPVYTYVGDSKPGTASGQGKNLNGGLWWVVSPSGTQITTTAAASSPAPSASKSSSGGGWA